MSTSAEERVRGTCHRSRREMRGSIRMAMKAASKTVMHSELAKKANATRMAMTMIHKSVARRGSKVCHVESSGGSDLGLSERRLSSISYAAVCLKKKKFWQLR